MTNASASDALPDFVAGIPVWCSTAFATPTIARCTVILEAAANPDGDSPDAAAKKLRMQASVDRPDVAILSAPNAKGADFGKVLRAVDVSKPIQDLWWATTNTFPTDKQRLAYESAKSKADAKEALTDKLEKLVGEKNKLKSFTNGQLTVEQDDEEVSVPMPATCLDSLREMAKDGFADIPELQSITVTEIAQWPNANAVMQPPRKLAEARISRKRAATINWDAITMANLVTAVDSAWHVPGANFVLD